MTAKAKSLNTADKNFLKEASQNGMFEIEAARIAAEKASDPQVKSFASRIVDDHTKANQQLQEIASARNLTLPSEIPAAKQRELDRLSSAIGTDFDRQFLQMVGVKGHKEGISDFERASRRARDAEVRQFASTNLPTLREHMSSAQQLASSLGTSGASTTTTPQGYTGSGDASSPSSSDSQVGGTGGSSPSQPSLPGGSSENAPSGSGMGSGTGSGGTTSGGTSSQ